MNKHVISSVLAGILWGSISIFLKTLSASGLSNLQIMMIRAVLAAILLFVFLLIKDKSSLKIHIRDVWMFAGTGILSLTFFTICYFYTILNSGASIAVILLYTSPIFVLLLSMLLFKEKITWKKLLALVMTFAGCIFVTGIGNGQNGLSLKSFLIGICAGFGYALYSIFSRFALKKYNSLTVTFYTFVFSGLSLIPFVHISQIPSFVSPKTVLFALGIALFCTVLPYILYTYSLSGLETGKAAILVTVEPLVGTLIGIFLWKEETSILKIAGIILIFVAVIILGTDEKSDS